jgi:hypothetical protein
MLERNYTQGNFNVDTPAVIIFGKPNNVENRFNDIFAELEKNIKDGNEGYVKFMTQTSKNFSTKLQRTIKENYQNLVSRKRGSFQNAVSKITQDLVNQEQSYISTLARLNLITFNATTETTGTDGLQAKNGPVTIYTTIGTDGVAKSSTATNTLLELVDDAKKIQKDIGDYNGIIFGNNKFIYPGNNTEYEGTLVFETTNGKSREVTTQSVFKPFSTRPQFEDFSFRRVYMIISDDITDNKKFETFKQQMIGNILTNNALLGSTTPKEVEDAFDEYWGKIALPAFLEENNITKSFIEHLEKNNLKNYLIYTPFDKKQREFTFTTENPASSEKKKSQENIIKGLANTTNQNTNINTWNDTNGNSTGAYISKAKLN